jgi:hypothetical protein
MDSQVVLQGILATVITGTVQAEYKSGADQLVQFVVIEYVKQLQERQMQVAPQTVQRREEVQEEVTLVLEHVSEDLITVER